MTDGDPRDVGGMRLHRNPRRGLIFGVCAGIAEYFAFDLTITRVLVVVACFFSFPLICAAYLILAFLLPVRSRDAEHAEPDPVARQVRASPHEALSSVRYRFRDLDTRLQRLEKYVTSTRYKLDREFQQLKD